MAAPTQGNLDREKQSLLSQHKEHHFTAGEIVRDIIIGVSDGLTVPFALAAGLSGANATSSIVLTAGVAEVAAGAISMGLGGYYWLNLCLYFQFFVCIIIHWKKRELDLERKAMIFLSFDIGICAGILRLKARQITTQGNWKEKKKRSLLFLIQVLRSIFQKNLLLILKFFTNNRMLRGREMFGVQRQLKWRRY